MHGNWDKMYATFAHALMCNRNVIWEVVDAKNESANTSIVLQLKESKTTLDMWPHPFLAQMTINLSTKLNIEFSVTNTGSTAFSFQLALHTYYTASDIKNISILGLNNVTYIDKVLGGVKNTEHRQGVVFNEEVDRVYIDVKEDVKIVDKVSAIPYHAQRVDVIFNRDVNIPLT